MNQPLLGGSVPWAHRLIAGFLWLFGLAMVASVLVFGFFVGTALLGIAALGAVIAWARLRWGKPIIPGSHRPANPSAQPRTGETIIDAEYVVIRRDERP